MWHKTASLIPLEEVAVRQGKRRVLNSYMSLWMKRAEQARLADAFNDRSVKRSAMARMGSALQKRISREQMAHEIVAARDRELLSKAIRIWSLVGRSKLYARVSDRRQERIVFGKWLGKMDRVHDLNGKRRTSVKLTSSASGRVQSCVRFEAQVYCAHSLAGCHRFKAKCSVKGRPHVRNADQTQISHQMEASPCQASRQRGDRRQGACFLHFTSHFQDLERSADPPTTASFRGEASPQRLEIVDGW